MLGLLSLLLVVLLVAAVVSAVLAVRHRANRRYAVGFGSGAGLAGAIALIIVVVWAVKAGPEWPKGLQQTVDFTDDKALTVHSGDTVDGKPLPVRLKVVGTAKFTPPPPGAVVVDLSKAVHGALQDCANRQPWQVLVTPAGHQALKACMEGTHTGSALDLQLDKQGAGIARPKLASLEIESVETYEGLQAANERRTLPGPLPSPAPQVTVNPPPTVTLSQVDDRIDAKLTSFESRLNTKLDKLVDQIRPTTGSSSSVTTVPTPPVRMAPLPPVSRPRLASVPPRKVVVERRRPVIVHNHIKKIYPTKVIVVEEKERSPFLFFRGMP